MGKKGKGLKGWRPNGFNASDKMVKKISSNGAAFFNFLF